LAGLGGRCYLPHSVPWRPVFSAARGLCASFGTPFWLHFAVFSASKAKNSPAVHHHTLYFSRPKSPTPLSRPHCSALYASASQAQTLLTLSLDNEALKRELITAKEALNRLQSKLKERELRRSKAEVLLAQAENRCKELVYAGSLQGKRVSELEKACKELENRIGRGKEAEEETAKVVFQRDEQLRRLITRLKSLEALSEDLKSDLKRKESAIFALQKRLKDTGQTLPSPEPELKTLHSRLLAKETELEVLKTMVKNLHIHPNSDPFRSGQRVQRRSPEPTASIKLPDIRGSRGFLSPKAILKGGDDSFDDFEEVEIGTKGANLQVLKGN
jgi:archaellum component FlaC